MLTPKSISAPFKNLVYSSSGPGKTYVYTEFFNENNPIGCAISCQVGDTCGGTLTGSLVSQTASATPWTITAAENILVGYDKTVCQRCTSGSTNFDQIIRIILKGDCSTSLTLKTLITPLSNHDYVSGGTGKTFDIDSF